MNERLLKVIGFYINLISYFSSKYAAKLAIKLFSIPQKGRLNEEEVQYLSTAIQEDIIHENISIKTYYWKGKKDTILLAHGWESNAYRWKPLIEILKSLGYTIITLDAPAHGDSGGKLFNAILYSECISVIAKKFKANAIIGHSVGGTATIFSQYKTPLESIKKLVSLGAPSDFVDIFKRYEVMMGYNKKVSQAIKQFLLRKYNHLPEYYSAANFSKEIKAKILVIHDKKDRIIPYTDGLKFKKNYETVQFIGTKGFGHGLKNDIVYNHIVDFLNA
ncbi:alpha/beta hydrolase family protein [Flavivirga jejuensis]|uniref:Alpha/beta hydrolase n=1 Tax=Flavivirga jejuensis TaxID=870487 RepID=A0ABT8WJL7_9FLAO|nr:alpha/beta hydrolase [Flavivirga jejuensis]MDO5973351.1 alpha/beta hydrolase [Flavivirga jejuensis]